MTDRRRTPRYVLEQPIAGDAMPMQDVMVEDFSDDRLVVVSLETHAIDEELLVYLSMPNGLERYRATVTGSTRVSVGGQLCCRLELHVVPAADADLPDIVADEPNPTASKEWKH
jgi:hypothetical protein